MKYKHRQAQKIATTLESERCYIYGWDDALKLAAELLIDLKKPELAILVKAVGSAEIDSENYTPTEDRELNRMKELGLV